MDLQEGGGDQGGRDPRAILPVEMWLPILDKLMDHPDPQDLIDAAATCTLFEDHLGDKVNSHRLAQVIPLVLKWLDHQDRLNCRSISKRVTKSVDFILDNAKRVAPNQNLNLFQSRFRPPRLSPNYEKIHFGFFDRRKIYFGRRKPTTGVFWESQAKVEQFHTEMSAVSSNGGGHPMIGRNLCLDPCLKFHRNQDDSLAKCRDLLELSLQLLPTYQDAISHLTFVGSEHTGNLIETYDLLRRILAALPNLYSFRGLCIDEEGLSYRAENVRNLARHIEENPMPPMRLLEDLTLNTSKYDLPVPLIQEVSVRYGCQLKRLESIQPADLEDYALTLFAFPELTHLKLGNPLPDRFRLMDIQANKLVHLNLNIGSLNELGHRFPEVVQYFTRFPCLRSLSLVMGCLLLNGLDSGTILGGAQCPSVKQFKFVVKLIQLPLAFFTQLFPNLESFQFQDWEMEIMIERGFLARESERDFDLLKNGRGYECDVWESCPSLKIFRFVSGRKLDTVYSRDGYLKREKAKASGSTAVVATGLSSVRLGE